MADTKVSALTAATTVAEADLIYLVTAALASRKMVLSDLFPGFCQVALGKRTAGNLSLNSTTWINLDTGLDLVIPGTSYAGDIVEVGMSGVWGAEATQPYIDVVSLISGSPVNTWAQDGAEAAGATGVSSWVGTNSVSTEFGGSIMRAIVSGDLSAGVLTLRFRYRASAATAKTLNAVANTPLHVWAKNHGQPKT